MIKEDLIIRTYLKKRLLHRGNRQDRDRAHRQKHDDQRPHGASGDPDRPQGQRGRQDPAGARGNRTSASSGSPSGGRTGAERAARRRVGREQLEKRVAFRRVMKKTIQSTMSRSEGRQDPALRPAGRRRNGAFGAVRPGPVAAAEAGCGHRLRLRRGEDDLWPHRRQVLDLQRRSTATRRPVQASACAGRLARRAPRGGLITELCHGLMPKKSSTGRASEAGSRAKPRAATR